MKTNNRGLLIIINALGWAAAILVTARFTEDANQQQNVVLWLITGWFVVNLLLSGNGGSAKSECVCLMRRLGWNGKR